MSRYSYCYSKRKICFNLSYFKSILFCNIIKRTIHVCIMLNKLQKKKFKKFDRTEQHICGIKSFFKILYTIKINDLFDNNLS